MSHKTEPQETIIKCVKTSNQQCFIDVVSIDQMFRVKGNENLSSLLNVITHWPQAGNLTLSCVRYQFFNQNSHKKWHLPFLFHMQTLAHGLTSPPSWATTDKDNCSHPSYTKFRTIAFQHTMTRRCDRA